MVLGQSWHCNQRWFLVYRNRVVENIFCFPEHKAAKTKEWVRMILSWDGALHCITAAVMQLLILCLLKRFREQDTDLTERQMGNSDLFLTGSILKPLPWRSHTSYMWEDTTMGGFLKTWDLDSKWQKLNVIYNYVNYQPTDICVLWNAFGSKYRMDLKFTEKVIPLLCSWKKTGFPFISFFSLPSF